LRSFPSLGVILIKKTHLSFFIILGVLLANLFWGTPSFAQSSSDSLSTEVGLNVAVGLPPSRKFTPPGLPLFIEKIVRYGTRTTTISQTDSSLCPPHGHPHSLSHLDHYSSLFVLLRIGELQNLKEAWGITGPVASF